MESIADKIKKARRTLDEKKAKKAELKGRRKALMEELFKHHKLRSISAAEARIDELERQIEEGQEELDEKMKSLDEMMEEMEKNKNGR